MTEPAKTADQDLYWSFYGGDTYNLSKKITLNLGVRVDLQGDWTERHNRIVALNDHRTQPIAGNECCCGQRVSQPEGRL